MSPADFRVSYEHVQLQCERSGSPPAKVGGGTDSSPPSAVVQAASEWNSIACLETMSGNRNPFL